MAAGGAMGGGFGGGMADGGDCEDCVKVVKTMKQVKVPCHRNEYKQFTVKVPKQVTETCPQTVRWTDYEKRTKSVPFQDFKKEKRVKYVNQKITVPDVKCVTKMVSITKKVPKTIYVDMTTQEPRQNIVHGTRTIQKTIKIPFEASVPFTNYKTVTYQVPVQKSKIQMVKRTKTVMMPETRTKCVPKVTMVTRNIPVYSVVAKPPAPCPPSGGMGGGGAMAMGGAAAGGMAMGGMAAGGASGGMMAAGGMASGMAASGGAMAVGGGDMGMSS